MKFAHALVVASMIAACVPLVVACGSASDSNLFSPSDIGAGHSGANDAHGGDAGRAGARASEGGNTSGGDAASGAPSGGTSEGEGGKIGDAGEAGAGPLGGGVAGASAGSSGSAGNSSAGGAGASGAGGTTGASGAGAGGMSLGGAGGGGAGAGGAGTGGMSLGGAGGGGAAAGGAGGANSCPALAPVDKTECSVSTPSSCFYSGVACSCLTGPGPAAPRKWACYGTPDKCPDAKPSAGNSCAQNVGAECPYPSQDYCICKGAGQDASWVCQPPSPTCLTNKPAQNLACGPVRACQYSDVSCFCNASKWSCLGG